MFGIARKRLADYYRSGAIKRRAIERLRWETPKLGQVEDEELRRMIEQDDRADAVTAALGELPEKRRRAVELRIVLGLPYQDVARTMGCSEQAARAHVSRGLRRLATTIGESESTGSERTAR